MATTISFEPAIYTRLTWGKTYTFKATLSGGTTNTTGTPWYALPYYDRYGGQENMLGTTGMKYPTVESTTLFFTETIGLSDMERYPETVKVTCFVPYQDSSTIFGTWPWGGLNSEDESHMAYDISYDETAQAPGAPTVRIENGHYVVSWTPAFNGDTTVTYTVEKFNPDIGWGSSMEDGIYYTGTTSNDLPVLEDDYGKEILFVIAAKYNNITARSAATTIVPSKATLTTPGIPTVAQSGGNFVVSWTPAVGTGGAAGSQVTYAVGCGFINQLGDWSHLPGTNTTITFPIDESYYDHEIWFQVGAYYSGLETYSGYSTITPVSGSMHYYTGGKWVECSVYYYTEGQWVQCVPYYHTGGKWTQCG